MSAYELLRRLQAAFRRKELDRGTEAEMQFHLQMEVEAGMRRGLDRDAAARAARIHYGSVTASLEAVRDQRNLGWLDGVFVDLRQAWTALRRRPGYLTVAAGALVSAVVVNTLVFTILYGVLLRPLPYAQPEHLVRLYEASLAQPKFPLSIYNYQEYKRSSRTLEGVALYTGGDMQLMHGERAELITAVAITEGFFPVLGIPPALGRNFLPSEMLRSARVVMLSHAFWKNRFQGDPSIIGKALRLDREDWMVIGIAAAGFQHVGGEFRSPLQGDTVSIWRPLPQDLSANSIRNAHYTNAIARLKPGISMAAARADLNAVMAEMTRTFPRSYEGKSTRLEPLSKEVAGKSRTTVLAIASGGALVLLLACINVAGLSIARAVARRRELAVRLALGGSRWRILRAILSENVILAVLSGAVGVVAAAGLLPVLQSLLPADFPRLHEVVFRWPSALFAVAAAGGTSLLAGLLTTLRRSNADAAEALHEDSRTASGSLRAGKLRGCLVAAQMALACVLCFAAILLLRSSVAIGDREHGFVPAGVLTFELSFPAKSYTDDRVAEFYAEAGRRLAEIPGVRASGFATSVPWTGYDENTSFEVPGFTPMPGQTISARYQAAGPGFVEALRMRLVAGRAISVGDHGKAPKVLLINEAFARQYFPGLDPLGRMIDVWGAKRQVVGVVADIHDTPADAVAVPAFWMSIEQQPFRRIKAVVRADGDAAALVPAIRAVLASLDRELPAANVRSLSDIAAAAMAERRFTLAWCAAFAGLAIVLAAVGIYALLAYAVQQRHREIAIRLALGATRPSIVGTVLRSGLLLAALGAGAGLLISPAIGGALQALLYGVSPSDGLALAIAPAVIALTTALACLAPARNAVRTEPIVALREQ